MSSDKLYVSGLKPGEYIFRLKTTNTWGITAYDDIKVTVQSTNNSWLEFTAVNGTENKAAGNIIKLYAGQQKAHDITVEDIYNNGNTHLQFYIKPISGVGPDLNSIQVSLNVNDETLYKSAGDYNRQYLTKDGWIPISIPLADFGLTTTTWPTGVVNIEFKIIPGLGNGTIVFGIDEIHFTGGKSTSVWCGDNDESRDAVYESDSTRFYISKRLTSGGLTDFTYEHEASTETDNDNTSSYNQVHVQIYNIDGKLIQNMIYQMTDTQDNLVNLRSLVDTEGLYIFRITNAVGKTKTRKIFFSQ